MTPSISTTKDIGLSISRMNKIKILPDNLANQIAAGEVVERPASVIKELIENSIDAGSLRIGVEVELGGRRLMRVSDSGEGMTRDDAVLSLERHATSKISKLEDLGAIGTLGFRGEALASIASVAKVEIVTKREDEIAGSAVTVDGGRLTDVRDAGRDRGTTISVRDLFFNTPARRKFMRSEATENYHIASIVTHYALVHPEIAFKLINNGREVINTPPAKDLRERAFQLFGAGLLESLLPVTGGREFVAEVSGFVSAPRERRTNRDSQYFFVNKRYVRDDVLAAGLREGYTSVLPHGVYPVAFLFIDIPLDEIDVNVHPAKTHVRFRRSEAVKEALAEAVRRALVNAGVGPETRDPSDLTEIPEEVAEKERHAEQPPMVFAAPSQHGGTDSPMDAPFFRETIASAEAAASANAPLLRSAEIDISSDNFEAAARARSEGSQPIFHPVEEPSAEPPITASSAMPPVDSARRFVKNIEVDQVRSDAIRPLGQLHESFIIAVDREGLLLIDQHVAHERILFDKFRHAETVRMVESQNLLLPETFDLTPAQAEAFSLIETELGSLGFDVMRLSGRTIAVRSIPTDLPPSETRNLFAEILDSFEGDKKGRAKALLRDDIAASLACKAAVKINMKLTEEKMRWLIDRLLTTSSPTTCPHGRPVILRLSMKDIERGFHRT